MNDDVVELMHPSELAMEVWASPPEVWALVHHAERSA